MNKWRCRGHRLTDYKTRMTDFRKLREEGLRTFITRTHALKTLRETILQTASLFCLLQGNNNKVRGDLVNPVVLIFICTAETCTTRQIQTQTIFTFFITHLALQTHYSKEYHMFLLIKTWLYTFKQKFTFQNAHQNSVPGSTNDAFAVRSPGAALDEHLFVVLCKHVPHIDCLPLICTGHLK